VTEKSKKTHDPYKVTAAEKTQKIKNVEMRKEMKRFDFVKTKDIIKS
jgi:hypothetical protein